MPSQRDPAKRGARSESVTYYFAGPLANTGGNLRSIKLASPFRIERWNYDKLASLIADMSGPIDWHPDHRVDELQCIPKFANSGHVVTARLTLEHRNDEPLDILRVHRELENFDKRLDEQIRLLSVFFSAGVLLPVRYWFAIGSDGVREMMSASEGRADEGERATPSLDQARSANAFLQNHSFQKRPDVLEIALDHWSHSFQSIPSHMQLLSLVTALEALLNPAQTELKHRVCRAAAVLIGRNEEESKEIYAGLGKVYDIRSQIVHTGQTKSLRTVRFWELRRWVSRVILAVLSLNLPKSELCARLVELGFGQGPSLTLRGTRGS